MNNELKKMEENTGGHQFTAKTTDHLLSHRVAK